MYHKNRSDSPHAMSVIVVKMNPLMNTDYTPPVNNLSYLEALNPPQRQAVETTEGPLLVLAGAGTGKTRVLITRLAHILRQRLAMPYQILAVTFTNKAAHEMRDRVIALSEGHAEGLWLGTFHSLSLRILRRHSALAGLKDGFTILDTDDQLRLIKQIMKAQDIDDKKNPPKLFAAIISKWKDRALLPEKVSRAEEGSNPSILKVYKEYQDRLKTLNAVDFGDLLLLCLTLFQNHPDILESYQRQFRYILVDEYQDTNVAQYLWLRLLAVGSGNICCVGDEDQSIYAWRGAEIGNILRFEHDFPGAVVIRLEQNYRSTPHILAAASALIQNNQGRYGKTLWTDVSEGKKVRIRSCYNSTEEAQYVCDEIDTLQRQGYSLSSMAILVRASFQTREFEDRLLVTGTPYRVLGGLRFYERQEIRDAMAYLRLVVQPEDGLAFERIANVPRRGIGTTTLQLIHTQAREANISLVRMAQILLEENAIKGAAKTGLKALFTKIDSWQNLQRTMTPADLMGLILDESGYTTMWQQEKSPDAPGRLENLKELQIALRQFDSLTSFLDHVSLVTDMATKTSGDMVTLMTLHGAKGLEFDVVFLPAWEEGVFPHPRSLAENGKEGLEEERRLAYVGITRAKKLATITHAHNRRTYMGWQASSPSRFLRELPADHVEELSSNGQPRSGGYATGYGSGGNSWYSSSSSHGKLSQTKGYGSDRSTIFDAEFSVDPSHNFQLHEKVFHVKFGYGKILQIEGDSITIEFDKAGIKTVMADYLERG